MRERSFEARFRDPMTDSSPAPSRAAVLIATCFGAGRLPRAPGTAGSLAAAACFAVCFYALPGALLPFVSLFVLAWLAPAALWSIEQALPEWTSADPRAIVIDEVVGQWLAYAGLLLAPLFGWPIGTSAGWKYLLAGFILFRGFDVLKPFPIRRSERLPGAAGILLDDVLAGAYAAAGLLLLVRSGWLE